jgi:hypothetical protein
MEDLFIYAVAVLIYVGLLVGVIAGGVWVVRAFVRRTTRANGRSIAFGLLTALATALLVFVLVYLAAWAEMRQSITMGDVGSCRIESMRTDFFVIRRELSDYFQLHRHYPDSLDEVPFLKDSRFIDAWGNEYQYSKTAIGYRLLSLGRDGKPGGVGLDADIDSEKGDDIFVEPTLSQFLFEAAGRGTLFRVAMLASFLAGLACYIASGPRDGRSVTARALLVSIAVSAAGAILVSLFLVSIYLMGEHH